MATLSGSIWLPAFLLVVSWLLYTLYNRVQLRARRNLFSHKRGCEPPASLYPVASWDLVGLGFIAEVGFAASKHEVLPHLRELHQRHGKTFVFKAALSKAPNILSIDAENVKCIMSTRMGDWAVKDLRQSAVGALLGNGIFTTDGAFWSHSRSLLRPQFEGKQVSEQVQQFEKYLPKLLARIPEGETIDLQDLFNRLTMDSSAEFLTGKSTNSLDEGEQSERASKFMESIEHALEDAAWRARLGRLNWIRADFQARKAIKYAREYIQDWVDKAVAYRDSLSDEEKTQRSIGQYIFINELAKQEEVDVTRIQDETLNIFIAGRDTTASLFSHLWFELSRRPDIWKKLQAEVNGLNESLPTYSSLKDMQYMKDCVRESMFFVAWGRLSTDIFVFQPYDCTHRCRSWQR